MARFEFSGVPSVTPTGAPSGDEQRISATPEMFGGSIARAEQTLGQGVEHTAEAGFDVLRYQHKVNADYESTNTFQDVDKLLYGDPSKSTTGADGKAVPDLGFLGLSGRDAQDRRADTEKAIEQRRQQGRANLVSQDAQYEYDMQTKRYVQNAYNQIGRHSEQQWKGWSNDVNKSAADQALNSFVRHLDDPDPLIQAWDATRYIQFKEQEAQVKYGNDPTIMAGVREGARRDLLAAHIDAVAVNDPQGAMKILEKNKDLAATKYDDWYGKLRTRAEVQMSGQKAGTYFTAARGAGAPVMTAQPGQAAPAAPTTSDRVHDAIIKQESGGNPNERTSINGAVGVGQIMPATFQQYAKPGESINSPKDNLAVSKRIIDDYYQRFGGDPQRVAVAYFSGPGNVSPPGSVNPWKRDVADGNGKTVSSYVNDISGRLGTPTAAVKAGAFQMAMNDPELRANQEAGGTAMHRTLTDIAQLVNAQEVAENQTAKQHHQAVETAAGDVTKRMFGMEGKPNQDWHGLFEEVRNNPVFADQPALMTSLLDRITVRSGAQQALTYGPRFFELKQRMLQEPGTPGYMPDLTDIYRVPPGDLTPAGEHELVQIHAALKKSPDEPGLQKARAGLETAIRLQMVREQNMGPVVIKNPVGEHLFNAQFIPQWSAAYAKWVEAGKNPWEFLTEKNATEMMNRIYPRNKRNADEVAMGAETGEAKGLPLPEAPEGIDGDRWHSVVAATPTTAAGKLTPNGWSGALQMLIANPSPEVQAAFDRKYGSAKVTAKDTLEKLGINPQAAIIAAGVGAPATPAGQEQRFPAARPPEAPPAGPALAPAAATPATPAGPAAPAYHGGRTAAPTEQELQTQEREIAERDAALAKQHAAAKAGPTQHGREPGERIPAGKAQAMERERAANEAREKARTKERLRQLDHEEATARENITNERQLERELKRIDAERKVLEKTPPEEAPKKETKQPHATAPAASAPSGAPSPGGPAAINSPTFGPRLNHGAHAKWRDQLNAGR